MKKYVFLVFASSLILVGALFTENYSRQSPVETPKPGTVFKATTPDGTPPSPQGGYPVVPAVTPTQEELLKRRAEIFKMNTATLATSSLENFEFSYPKKAFIAGYGWEKVGFEGDINIVIEGQQEVFIFTQPAPMTSFNPSARSLADYESSYATSATGTRQQLINGTLQDINIREQVLISTSTQVDVSGIKMLRSPCSTAHIASYVPITAAI